MPTKHKKIKKKNDIEWERHIREIIYGHENSEEELNQSPDIRIDEKEGQNETKKL